MAFYNRVKAAKNVPIGTIIPWCGSSSSAASSDGIPHGYIICDAAAKGLKAVDYPLLANKLGNTYGPFPENATDIPGIGGNIGISNPYPYNGDPLIGHVDTFDLPDMNQRAYVDIEYTRVAAADPAIQGILGIYISKNGIEGTQPLTLYDTDVDILFAVEADDTLSGKITGHSISEPSYFDSIYSIPRKLGIDHTPGHVHMAASDNDYDAIKTATAYGLPVLTFQPGVPTTVAGSGWSKDVTPVGAFRNVDPPESWKIGSGLANITWYDVDNESQVLNTTQKNVAATKNIVPLDPGVNRNIPAFGNAPKWGYQDDGSGLPSIQVSADTGPIPAPGNYNGFDNYHHSEDVPDFRQGVAGGQGRPTDPTYDPDAFRTYPTTKNHNAEEWASTALRAHTHDPIDIEMTRGVRMSSSILVNNVSTSSATPLSVQDALNIAMNVNTPSLTTIYIMRAF